MTKKDFFTILVKLFGLYIFITTLFSTVPFIMGIAQMESDLNGYLYGIGCFALFGVLFFLLLTQAEKVVIFLKLDKGFDTDFIQIEKLDKMQILQLGLIIVGGLVFLEHLPELLSNCFYLFKSMSQKSIDIDQTEFRTNKDYVYIAKDVISVILGYLILTNHDLIAKKIS